MAKRRKAKQKPHPLAILRIAVAIIMFLHGTARLYHGIVDDFGEFLLIMEIPYGVELAWAITVFEILGAGLLVSGRLDILISALFVAELSLGLALVHWKEGWFVVGSGRNGMEFSVLLIVCFGVIILDKVFNRT